MSVLAGRAIAVDAVKHVEVLNIADAAELDVPVARRFANVEEVNILCVVKQVDGDVQDTQELSVSAVTMTIPFLSAFPKLKRAFVGGLYRGRTLEYTAYKNLSPDDHQTLWRGLIESFCGAFKSRALSQQLDLAGILRGDFCNLQEEQEEDSSHPCRLCFSICAHFPLNMVMKLWGPGGNDDVGGLDDVCIPDRERLQIMRSRPGANAFFFTQRRQSHTC